MNESLDAVAERCFEWEEERRQQSKRERKIERWKAWTDSKTADSAETVGCVFSMLRFGVLWAFFGALLGSGTVGFLSTIVTLLLFRFLPPRLRKSRRINAFRAGESEAVLDVYRFAAREFRQKIDAHRTRTLGSKSEWAAARGKLAKAVDEADRSAAYWRNRVRQERGDQVVARQLKTAFELEKKLRSALNKLDGRADVLRKFYNECEARVSVMDRYNRDIEETRRLERLSGTADVMIAGAEATLMGIGASFVREAQRVGEVFGDFERLQLQTFAGEAPLDDIEVLADRINQSSESTYANVEQLSRVIEEFAEPLEP